MVFIFVVSVYLFFGDRSRLNVSFFPVYVHKKQPNQRFRLRAARYDGDLASSSFLSAPHLVSGCSCICFTADGDEAASGGISPRLITEDLYITTEQ